MKVFIMPIKDFVGNPAFNFFQSTNAPYVQTFTYPRSEFGINKFLSDECYNDASKRPYKVGEVTWLLITSTEPGESVYGVANGIEVNPKTAKELINTVQDLIDKGQCEVKDFSDYFDSFSFGK